MAAGDATAADVPGKYDVVINGKGYVLLDTLQASIPFRTHRAIYDITPTFIQRQNVSGNFGDNQQDFFLTASQNNWVLGEQQRFFRATDSDSIKRCWQLSDVDVSEEGSMSLAPATASFAIGAAVTAIAGFVNGGTGAVYGVGLTNLYQVTGGTGSSSLGAHGLGAGPSSPHGVACDRANVFISTTGVGSVGVRSYTSSFATFSATTADALEFLNNTLYGLNCTTGELFSYSSAGAKTSIFIWKNADGTARQLGADAVLRAFGGKLLIGFDNELWQYDGTSTNRVAQFPINFQIVDAAVVDGIVLVSGSEVRFAQGFGGRRPMVYQYTADGSIALIWRALSWIDGTVSTTAFSASIAPISGAALFQDDTTGRLMYYDLSTGAVYGVGAYTVNTSTDGVPLIAGSKTFAMLMRGGSTTKGYLYPQDQTYAASGYVATSLFDFDSSLTKTLRGVTVDWEPASDGNGGSVDISYQLNSLDGSYTSLTASATSGTEYAFSAGTTCRSVSIKVTLNKGTSTQGPKLKRIYVRAAPQLRQFKSAIYTLDCTNSSPDEPRYLRNRDPHPLTGYDQVKNLLAAAQATTPFSVTDKINSTFTGLVDLQDPEGWDVYEVHPDPSNPTKPGSYVVRVKIREV